MVAHLKIASCANLGTFVNLVGSTHWVPLFHVWALGSSPVPRGSQRDISWANQAALRTLIVPNLAFWPLETTPELEWSLLLKRMEIQSKRKLMVKTQYPGSAVPPAMFSFYLFLLHCIDTIMKNKKWSMIKFLNFLHLSLKKETDENLMHS